MRFDTDKVDLGYLPTYLGIAATIGVTGRVCEIGVWRGGSLEMWQALFPSGLVVGVDRSDGAVWPTGTIQVVCEQDADELPGILARHSDRYDLIVEDGAHVGALSRRTWELLWPMVAAGGFYVMEDWQVAYWPGWDGSMLDTARSFLDELAVPGEVESILYRHGQVVIHKA